MKFLKPKFWDNDKSFIYPILLIPIALLISLIGKIKKIPGSFASLATTLFLFFILQVLKTPLIINTDIT